MVGSACQRVATPYGSTGLPLQEPLLSLDIGAEPRRHHHAHADFKKEHGLSTPVARNWLFAYLDTLAIKTTTIDHPATFTVEQSSAVDLGLPGAHSKNLFSKGR